jgi:hypothetical protein
MYKEIIIYINNNTANKAGRHTKVGTHAHKHIYIYIYIYIHKNV